MENMTGHHRLLTRIRIVPMGAVVVIVGYLTLPYLLSRVDLATTLVSGIVVLAVLGHLGLFGSLCVLFRHRLWRETRGDGNSAARRRDPG